jgi:hypothetical protein
MTVASGANFSPGRSSTPAVTFAVSGTQTVPALGASTIVNNDGVDTVLGVFAQGLVIMANSQLFAIDYAGGIGNDIVLTVVPEPSTTAMISVAATLLLALQCWRRRPFGQDLLARLVIIARK